MEGDVIRNTSEMSEMALDECHTQAHYQEICYSNNNSLTETITIPGYCVPPEASKHGLDLEEVMLKLVCHGVIWSPEVTQRIVTLFIIMTLTLFGNVTIIIVLTCSKYRKLHSRVNIFIVNLAIGDLTVCAFTMTTEVLFVVFEGAWVLGAVACKVLLYIQIITLASTTFILTAMSLDRYLAICQPLSLAGPRARRSIILAWLLALIFASPQLFIFKEVPDGIYPDGEIKFACKSRGYTAWWQRKLYITAMTLYILIIPTMVISYCYINVVRVVWKQGKEVSSTSGVMLRRTANRAIPKAKVKTVKMTLSIILSFIMCWTPYFVVHLIHIWYEYRYNMPETVYVFAETMALLNSALNPILYGCFNIKLKHGLMEVFCPSKVMECQSTQNTSNNRATDYQCLNVVESVSTHCADAPSTSSSSSKDNNGNHGTNSSGYHGTILKETVYDTGDGKNGYKLHVRFSQSEPEVCKIPYGLDKELLSDSFVKEDI